MDNPPLASLSLTHVHYVKSIRTLLAVSPTDTKERTRRTESPTSVHGLRLFPKDYVSSMLR